MAKVVIINGYPGSGKDEFVKLCKEMYPNTLNFHTSDPAKDALIDLGWDGEKTPEARKLLADMMEFSYKFDGPLKFVADMVGMTNNKAVVFVHCRELKNVIVLRDMFNATTIFIDREEAALEVLGSTYFTSVSDREAAEGRKQYKYTVNNNGTLEDLKRSARAFMTLITGELVL